MAVEIITVTPEQRDAGYELLSKTDEIGFNAIGAGWYLPEEGSRWRFFLVTSLIDSQGPRWVYERLLKALRVMRFPEGITPLELHLVSPREARFYDLGRRLRTPEMAHPKNLFFPAPAEVKRYGMAAMAIYRMRDPDTRAAETARRFDERVQELLAA